MCLSGCSFPMYSGAMMALTNASRQQLLRRGLWLSVIVVLWNVVEGVVAVAAGLIASSVALISFGVDSSIEILSAFVVTCRLWSELQRGGQRRAEGVDARAARITGNLLFVLAAYISVDAGRRLLGFGEEAATSIVGIVLTSLSLLAMPVIGWAKLRTAKALDSRAMRADAYETIACAWLSFTTLVGLALNARFEWAWADPLAALIILPLILREGIEARRNGKETD